MNRDNQKATIIFHPIRIRIIQVLAGGREKAAQEIGNILRDVPQATLYRHIKILRENGILRVAGQRAIGGNVEKVYSLVEQAVRLDEQDFAALSREQLLEQFISLTSSMISRFQIYLDQDQFDLVKDGVHFRETSLVLTEEEVKEITREIEGILERFQQREASTGRRYQLSSILIPDPKQVNEG